MSGHDSKYFSTTKKGEIPELKEELNSQYKVPSVTFLIIYFNCYVSFLNLFNLIFYLDFDTRVFVLLSKKF